MTNHETAAIDRIPITRSVSYAVRDAPELPAHGATIPGTTLAPTQITFTYQAAPDSQLGRIQARVKGFWMRDGGRVNPGQPMAQHYFDGLTDWPEWLAEEARLHDPEAAVSVPPPAPQAADRRARYAAAIAEGFRAFDADTTSDAYLDAELLDAVIAAADAEQAVTRADALAAAFREAAEALGRMDYDTDSHDYGYDTYRDAWNGGVMDGADLLRRLADESAVVPPPALTEEGRLRAQVEVLQQDAERDQGLAKVGARCMRDGHQGLIEQGRLVLEGWRFALSTALDLGTGAPWEAIHERVKELTAAAPGPVAGEQQNETPEAETVHAVPLPGSNGISSCCGRPPCEFVGERVTRDLDKVTCPGPAAGVRQDGATS